MLSHNPGYGAKRSEGEGIITIRNSRISNGDYSALTEVVRAAHPCGNAVPTGRRIARASTPIRLSHFSRFKPTLGRLFATKAKMRG